MTLILTDFIILGFVLVSSVAGAMRGGLCEFASVLCWCLAFIITLMIYPLLSPLEDFFRSATSIANIFILVLSFLACLIALKVMARIVLGVLATDTLGPISRIIGGGVGFVRGIVTVSFAYLAILLIWTPSQLPPWVLNAESFPIVQSSSDLIVSALPDVIAKVETFELQAAVKELRTSEKAGEIIENLSQNFSQRFSTDPQ